MPQPVNVSTGYFVQMTQITGRVAVDTTGSATYSDMAWVTSIWSPIGTKHRFYLTTLTNYSAYQTSFSISHTYNLIGIYNIILTFSSSNVVFQQTVNITDCNLI